MQEFDRLITGALSSKVSVIVPAYNAECYLERCAESVLNQTYLNLELLIINDGSLDGTAYICDELARRDARVVIIHQRNSGVSLARNAGIERSTGEYLTFLDADDTLVNDALEIMVSCLEDAQADIAGFISCCIEEGETRKSIKTTGEQRILVGKEALEGALEDRPFSYAVWAKLYRRSVIGQTRFLQGVRVHEDAFFLFECFCKQPAVVLCDRHVHWYYVTPNSASRSRFSDKFLDILKVSDLKMGIIREQFPNLEEKAYNVIVKSRMALLQNLCGTWDKEYRIIEYQCIKTVKKYREYFVSATEFDHRWLLIIVNNLYYAYKMLWWIKRCIKR